MKDFFTLRTRADRQLAFGSSVLLLALLTGVGFALLLDSARPVEESRLLLRADAQMTLVPGHQRLTEAPPMVAVLMRQQARRQGPAKIVIIIDDLGMSPAALDRLTALPPPLTLSFLPYAPDVQRQVDQAIARDHEIMLHLPMEASLAGEAEAAIGPGPNALLVGQSNAVLRQRLANNLNSFTGYQGVNNHMGSRFTQSNAKMKLVLTQLDQRGAFFLDSRTTGASRVKTAAAALGLTTLRRDVFLDADFGAGGAAYVAGQLRQLEVIAKQQGSAIAIGHPYDTTLEALGPWLVSAEARGFMVVGASSLRPAKRTLRQIAQAQLQAGN
ncbi:MAG: divergent polysaccharide deacetylase family protein [Parvularculaceae bacterium]